ncbi:hypothetical protein L210DRAFT_3410026 [Boletus edulis BED1]|uniref:phosphatidylinositol-3,4,5-trisphosphate 3-phosphatase n=1 Tax=Boletus edulis BED1 TaxID=1328754 RepID=A0AAD4BN41_BOLED|nr:hypothetical protein L210DRAFT_3410026 [Boletus edulis BED1]
MSLYLKRLVSGKKARYKDNQLNLELDLAYVTDQIIVMGFPAVGVEGIYRNHRADVQRFLSTRHGSDFWVFNFCPVRENAYHDNVFEGRVSRYPFPDHHVPPFLYLPLATREIHAWLSGSDTRVAVLHCKAGKGRSGTLACAYLLSRYSPPSASMPSSLFGDWSLIGEKEGLRTPSPEITVSPAETVRPPVRPVSRVSSEPVTNTLEMVLDLHTSRRMKPTRYHPDVSKKPKMGVSIPSQQRWLFYWSQVLAGKGPPSLRLFQPIDRPERQQDLLEQSPQITKVKLTKLTVRMREPAGIQPHLVQAASVAITSSGKGRAMSESTTGKLWACLARYNDRLIDELEHWEKESRGPAGAIQSSPFKSDRWDKTKMISSFAQMSTSDIQPTQQGQTRRPVLTYILRPLDGTEGDQVKLRAPIPGSSHECQQQQCTSGSESSSFAFVSPSVMDDDAEDSSGIMLEADRELRIKLFMGEVALGWVWLIPAFHVSPDASSSSLVLSSDDIDFAIGIGKALVDMRISFTCQPCNQGS